MMSAKTQRKTTLSTLRFHKFHLTIVHLDVIIFVAKALGELVGLFDLLLGAVVGGHPGSIALCRAAPLMTLTLEKIIFLLLTHNVDDTQWYWGLHVARILPMGDLKEGLFDRSG